MLTLTRTYDHTDAYVQTYRDCYEKGTTGISIKTYYKTKVLKFVDDTKIFRTNKGDAYKQSLLDDLDTLVKWSENGNYY